MYVMDLSLIIPVILDHSNSCDWIEKLTLIFGIFWDTFFILFCMNRHQGYFWWR